MLDQILSISPLPWAKTRSTTASENSLHLWATIAPLLLMCCHHSVVTWANVAPLPWAKPAPLPWAKTRSTIMSEKLAPHVLVNWSACCCRVTTTLLYLSKCCSTTLSENPAPLPWAKLAPLSRAKTRSTFERKCFAAVDMLSPSVATEQTLLHYLDLNPLLTESKKL